MITGKQRAYLRKISHDMQPVFQIGKEGITENLLKGIDDALEKREILKVTILESAMLDTKETCNDVAQRLHAEPVQAIGSRFILYRRAEKEKNRKIELPKPSKR